MTEEQAGKAIDEFIRREVESFKVMCPEGQNPVLSVLRVHLLTEYQIQRIFHLILPRGDKIADSSLSYAQKIALLESLDVVADRTLQCLKNLNRVRNRCAHEREKDITAADVESIGGPLGKEQTRLRRALVDDVPEYLRRTLSSVCRDLALKLFKLENAQLPEEETEETEPAN
jgi:hypothetical protein